jgi:hypothetical protein
MSSILDSKSLINTIKRRASIPSSQETFSNNDFLEMATEEINIGLMDQLMLARGDYLVQFEDKSLVPGVNNYSIPDRAVGNKLRDVCVIDNTGKVIYELSQITIEELSEFEGPYVNHRSNTFYIQNNEVIITPQPSITDYKIRMYFYIRPNKLVLNERAATVSTITDNGTTVELGFVSSPKHFTTSIQYDVVGAKSPNKIKSYNITPVSINLNTSTLVVNKADISNESGFISVSVGDYVTQAEETIVPNIPTELHPIVAQRVAIACLESMGDEQNKQSAERKLASMEKSALRMLVNRVEGAPRAIKQRHGTLNQTVGQRRKNRNW